MDKVYVAHKIDEPYKVQTVKEHLLNTAELAEKFSAEIGFNSLGNIVGLLHDLGKFSDEFLNRIMNEGKRCDHSTAGAKYLNENLKNKFVAEALGMIIAGHHSGLLNYGYDFEFDEGTYIGRMKKDIPDYSAFKNEMNFDNLDIAMPRMKMSKICIFLWIKMLFSCLVDADYLDTENFMRQGEIYREIDYSFEDMAEKLLSKLSSFKQDNELNKLRTDIRIKCEENGKNSTGIFSLTVPTGGGKTLSSMAFALNQIKEFGHKRIIYVIPFTSIIEQNAEVYKKIFGDSVVLEHHSGMDFEGDEEKNNPLKYATENWDAPIVVTTNVQFFESLMSSKTSKSRKLHNIANSVIIFDEIQAIPSYYNKICYGLIEELNKNYNCSIVLCSATQPDYSKLLDVEVKEICDNSQYLFDKLKRCKISSIGNIDIEDLIEKIKQHSQALVIVNTKKRAKETYKLIDEENTFHLSRYMCAEHIKKVLDTVKGRLNNKMPVKLISTNLIEAGVDIDFPIVYRELTGLDSIIQSGGRCNREGKLKNAENVEVLGETLVFELNRDKPYSAKNPFDVDMLRKTGISKRVFEEYGDVTKLSAIQSYFEKLYDLTNDEMDKDKLFNDIYSANDECFKTGKPKFDFKDYSDKFKMINNNTYSVICPYNDEAKDIIDEIKRQIKFGMLSKSLIRKAQKYIVTLYDYEIKTLTENHCVSQISKSMFILEDMNMYDKDRTGIELEIETGLAIFT